MQTMNEETKITFDKTRINDNARWMLDVVAGHTSLLSLFDGQNLTVILYDKIMVDGEIETSDDILSIAVEDQLTWSERAREFGVFGLDRSNWSGKVGPTGEPIPTEAYIQRMVAFCGDETCPRQWTTPVWILKQVQGGLINGLEAINLIGNEFVGWIKKGKFTTVKRE